MGMRCETSTHIKASRRMVVENQKVWFGVYKSQHIPSDREPWQKVRDTEDGSVEIKQPCFDSIDPKALSAMKTRERKELRR